MAWLSDWAHRIKLTASGSCIDGDLSNFPIMVRLDSTCSGVFSELGSNSKKITVTTSGGVEQCYIEIENWDNGNNKAWLWTKVLTLSSGTDTDIYLYYDSSKDDNTTYVGDVGSTPARNVWDSNFVGVWHMSQDPSIGGACIKDSTSNANNGTPGGSMTSGDLVDGKVGKALDFDGSDDTIAVTDTNSLDIGGAGTVETLVNTSVFDNAGYPFIVAKTSTLGYVDKYRPYAINVYNWSGVNYIACNIADGTNSQSKSVATTGAQWDYFVGRWDGTNFKIYLDGGEVGTLSQTVTPFNSDSYLRFSGEKPPTFDYPYQGSICEIRISNIDRSAPWIKATYHSNWNTLLNYSSVEDIPYHCFSGVVKVEDVLSARKVNLYDQITGELLGYTTSSSVTGVWSIGVYGDMVNKCFAVCIPESESRNAEIFAHLTGV